MPRSAASARVGGSRTPAARRPRRTASRSASSSCARSGVPAERSSSSSSSSPRVAVAVSPPPRLVPVSRPKLVLYVAPSRPYRRWRERATPRGCRRRHAPGRAYRAGRVQPRPGAVHDDLPARVLQVRGPVRRAQPSLHPRRGDVQRGARVRLRRRDPATVLARAAARGHDRAVRASHRQPPVRRELGPSPMDRLVRLRLAARRHAADRVDVARGCATRSRRPQARADHARASFPLRLPPSRKEHHVTVVEGVPARRNPLIRLTYALARREVKRMTGKSLLTPDIPVRAHRFRQLVGYAQLEKSVAKRPLVPEHLRALAVLKS